MNLLFYLETKNLIFSGPVDERLTSQLFLCAHIFFFFFCRIDSIAGLFPSSALFRTLLSLLSVYDRIQRNTMMYENEGQNQSQDQITREERKSTSNLVIIKFLRLLLHKSCLRRIRLQPMATHPLTRETFPKTTLESGEPETFL